MTINITEDFGYCLWFIPKKNEDWNKYSSGFTPHISIYTHLNRGNLNKYKKLIDKQWNIKIKLKGDIYQTEKNNFYALQSDVEIDENYIKPDWWPSNAHISFRYKYNFPFSKDDISKLNNILINKYCVFDTVIFMNCNGDYSTWKKIQ